MNTTYLDTMPEVANEYNVDLANGEKVVFTAKLDTFGTEKDRMLGTDNSKFTLTNRGIIINNGVGVWTIDLPEIASWKRVKTGWWIFKFDYFAVDLNREMTYDDDKQKLTGFHFYFHRTDRDKFEEIMKNLFG
ncbi:hypothetical protein FWH58_01025 [Candidatus Saccharibacteria bacterium]|nr:hypothetical protein [Candidatus Saccharibacteria bacterium]